MLQVHLDNLSEQAGRLCGHGIDPDSAYGSILIHQLDPVNRSVRVSEEFYFDDRAVRGMCGVDRLLQGDDLPCVARVEGVIMGQQSGASALAAALHIGWLEDPAPASAR